jgi:hypothetical protein
VSGNGQFQVLDFALHVQGSAHSPLGLILVGDRRSKQSHDAVTDELVHVAAPSGDGVGHRIQARRHERPDILGVKTLRYGSEAG